MKHFVAALLVVLAFMPAGCGPDTQGQFENDGLWEWFMEPTEIRLDEFPFVGESPAERTLPAFLCKVADGRVRSRVLNVQNVFPLVVCGTDDDSRLRLVAFDENRQRLEFGGGGSCGYPGASLRVGQVTLGHRKLRYLGVEHLTPENQRRRAQQAQEKLLQEGIALSYPVEGNAFPYHFDSPDGKPISSEQHLGQVVLIQWWASW